MTVGVGRGHGKVILLGEHAAVYGYAALAGAIDRGVTITARATPGPLRLRVPAWQLDVAAGDDHRVARALVAIGSALGLAEGWRLDAEATVPPGAGLGSSAATAVAITRALAAGLDRALAPDEVTAIADRAERCFHGNPSGLDVALAAAGGLGRFRRSDGLTPVAAAGVPLAIGLSGEPRSTAVMVARVAAARAAAPSEIDARLAWLGECADAAVGLVERGEWPELGTRMNSAHNTLAGLGVSTPGLDAMVAAARGAGALGAKLTGGGGGGAIIALAPGAEAAVLAAWRALGKAGFVTTLGGAA